jgi:hypothetical protein
LGLLSNTSAIFSSATYLYCGIILSDYSLLTPASSFLYEIIRVKSDILREPQTLPETM